MDDRNESMQQASNEDYAMKHLTFQIANQHYGIPIDSVIEIVQILPVTKLPELPYYAKGVINLRGRIIPLIDVNVRFGNPEREYTDRTCIIIVNMEGVHMGLVVEAVEEVVSIINGQVCPKPTFSETNPPQYVTGIAKTEKQVILLLDAKLLCSEDEVDKVRQITNEFRKA